LKKAQELSPEPLILCPAGEKECPPAPEVIAASAPNVRYWRKVSMVCAMDLLSAAALIVTPEMQAPRQNPTFQKQA